MRGSVGVGAQVCVREPCCGCRGTLAQPAHLLRRLCPFASPPQIHFVNFNRKDNGKLEGLLARYFDPLTCAWLLREMGDNRDKGRALAKAYSYPDLRCGGGQAGGSGYGGSAALVAGLAVAEAAAQPHAPLVPARRQAPSPRLHPLPPAHSANPAASWPSRDAALATCRSRRSCGGSSRAAASTTTWAARRS